MFGGLGNQLFQFFAAKQIQASLNCELIFDFTQINSALAHRNSDIRDFDFFKTEKSKITESDSPLSRNFLRGRNLLARRSESISRLLKIDAPGVREPKISSHLKDRWRIEGYYQDFDYYFEHLKRNPDFTWKVNQTNPILVNAEKEFQSKQVLALHVRGGDYLKSPKTYRQLDVEYYERALEYLSERFRVEEYVLFTDDIQNANRVMAPIREYKFKLAPNLPASNSLLLMSRAKGIVSSNSTFSAWAAVISGTERHVTSPAIWFNDKKLVQPTLPRANLL